MRLSRCNFLSFEESFADATTLRQQNDAIRTDLAKLPPYGVLVVENHPFKIHQHHIEKTGWQLSLRRESSKRTLIFRTK